MKTPDGSNGEVTRHITVVVCTFNRAAMLREALASLVHLRTDGFTFDIVVVNNASTDETPAVIDEFASRAAGVAVRGVLETRQGVAFARNRGIEEARGPWIAFFDDDQVADPDWLVKLSWLAESKQARVVGGAVRLKLEKEQPESFRPIFERVLWQSGRGDAACRYDVNNAPGTGNLMIHRDVFDRVGRFAESLREAGEDTELFHRITTAGIAAWYTPDAIVFHHVPAYRLTPAYLRWTTQRQGWSIVRRDWNERGSLAVASLLAARLGQAGLINLPALAAGWMLRRPGRVLDRRCRLWRATGYLRGALSLFAPRLFPQDNFCQWLDFRSERTLFAHLIGKGTTA